MAAAAQKLALEILRDECVALEERYEGYRVDAITRLGAILQIEQRNPTAIVKEVTLELEDFGNALATKTTT